MSDICGLMQYQKGNIKVLRQLRITQKCMNLASDDLNRFEIFQTLCLPWNIVILVLPYLMALAALFCHLMRASKVVLLTLPQLNIE